MFQHHRCVTLRLWLRSDQDGGRRGYQDGDCGVRGGSGRAVAKTARARAVVHFNSLRAGPSDAGLVVALVLYVAASADHSSLTLH